VGFVVDKVALGHVFSEYIGFRCQFSFQQIQLVADVPSVPTLDSTPNYANLQI
jgi:hypothetical protein